MRIETIFPILIATLAVPMAAAAQDVLVIGGGTIDLTFPSAGATQELGLYAEVERGGFYGGALGLISKDSSANKVDVYAGYRGETKAGFSYDLSYHRFLYPNDGGDCCGEVALSFGQFIRQKINLTAELSYDPAASLGGIDLSIAFAATDALKISTNYQIASVALGADEKTWDFGVVFDVNENASLDLRYFDGPAISGYLGISASFETNPLGG